MQPDTATHDVLRVLLAARLSNKRRKDDQGNDRQGIGIETQDEYSRAWAEAQHDFRTVHGVYRRIEVIDTMGDYKSGRVQPWDRPKLRPWVTRPDLMARYDAILAYKNDRWSRGKWEDEAEIRKWASDNGKVLIIVDGPQWPPRDDGDFWSWTAMAKQAEKEWEAIQERILRFQSALRANGGLLNGGAAFGYGIVGEEYRKTLAPNALGRKYVPQVFGRIAEGQSEQCVTDWLNAEGLVTTQGNPWTRWAVSRMIHNPVYRGQRMNAAGQVEMEVEALVDAKLWKRANDRLANKLVGRRGPKEGDSALATGALFCQRCGGAMYRTKGGRRSVAYYYRCTGTAPRYKGCGNMVRQAETDLAVAQILAQAPDSWKELRLVEGVNHDAELAEIELDLEALPKRHLPESEEDAERARLRAERKRLMAQPAIPDRWDEVEVCATCAEQSAPGTPTLAYLAECEASGHVKMTVGQHWARLDHAGRRAMLLDDVKIYAKAPPPELRKISSSPIIRIESRLFQLPVTWAESA